MNKNNTPTYVGSVFFVENIAKSKEFYTHILGQTIEMDFGRCIGFIGGFSLWDSTYAHSMIGIQKTSKHDDSQNNVEIYFEINNLDTLYQQLQQKDISFIHPIKEQPWGQRCFRIYDPDHHILEIAEPMSVVIKRYATQGLSTDEIIKKTLMPREIVQSILSTK